MEHSVNSDLYVTFVLLVAGTKLWQCFTALFGVWFVIDHFLQPLVESMTHIVAVIRDGVVLIGLLSDEFTVLDGGLREGSQVFAILLEQVD